MSARIDKLMGVASLQGTPLTGYRRFGVPPGGAFDQESYRLGNALLGNQADALVLELSNSSIEIAYSVATRVAVTGAPIRVECGEQETFANAAFDVPAGSILKIFAPRHGLRVYVAVAGGWLPDGIDSALGRAGHPVCVGDMLQHGESTRSGMIERLADLPSSFEDGPIRVIRGPNLAPNLRNPVSDFHFSVSNDSDRTGLRLNGLPPMETAELTSEPACVGAIQITPGGQLIVIGPDGPTIGGYPKIAAVCTADLDRISQLRPGQEITFEEVEIDRALAILKEREARLAHTLAQIQIARSF